MYACRCVCMYVCIYACKPACMHVSMYGMYVCMYVWMYTFIKVEPYATDVLSFSFAYSPISGLKEIPSFIFLNYAYICTWIKGSLRETVLPSIITWPERGKQNTQAKEFYWIVYNFKKLYVENLFTCQYSTCLWRDH